MKFDTSKIEALEAARTRLENKFKADGWASSKDLITCNRIQNLLCDLYVYGELKEKNFARWAELTKEPTPDPKPYEPTEEEKNWLEAEAHEEQRKRANAYYEGYSNEL